MPDFRFRLTTLMKLRLDERDQRRTKLAEAQQAAEILAEQARELVHEQESVAQQLRASAVGSVVVERLLDVERYGLVLHAQMVQLRERRALIDGEIERRRQSLVEADREVKVLEKLRDKQWSEYQAQEFQREIRQFDEMAGQREAGKADQE